jgi:hypothetical protein
MQEECTYTDFTTGQTPIFNFPEWPLLNVYTLA